jgi:hypothetical protein
MHRIVSVIAAATCWSFAAAAEPVPQEMLGAWAKDGRCSLVSERLAITPATVTFGDNTPGEAQYSANDRGPGQGVLRWKRAEGDGSGFQYVASSDVLAFYGMGWGMGGPTAVYRRCR